MSASTTHVEEAAAVTALRRKDLLGISDLAPDEISLILDTAEAMKEVGERPSRRFRRCAARRSSICSSSRARALGRRSRSRKNG